MTAIDPARCPLCRAANECQLALERATCWCFFVPVPREALDRVPADARGLACVCRRCADGTTEEQKRRHLAMRWTRR